MKFYIGNFYENLLRNYKFGQNWTKKSGTLREDQSVCHIVGSDIMYFNNTQNALLCYYGNTFSIYNNDDSDIYANPTKGTHCCVFMATMVMPTHHNVTLCIKCYLFLVHLTKQNRESCSQINTGILCR